MTYRIAIVISRQDDIGRAGLDFSAELYAALSIQSRSGFLGGVPLPVFYKA